MGVSLEEARARVEPLTRALKDNNPVVQRTAARALFSMGELVAAEAVIDWLFESGNPYDLVKYYSREFLGDYTDYILRASSSYMNQERIPVNPTAEAIWMECQYELWGSNGAIQRLCEIRTQVSSNILHKVAQKRDVQVEKFLYETSVEFTTLSFDLQRRMAQSELESRGNPPYDPSVYLKKEAWKIP